MEKRWDFRKALSFIAVMSMASSMLAVPTVTPLSAAVEHQYELIDMVNASKSEQVADGDFEAGGTAWNQRNKGTIVDGVSYNGGSKSGCVPNTAMSGNNVNGYIGQKIAVSPNTDYVFKGYVRSDVEGAKANVSIRANNDSGTMLKDIAIISTEWKEFSITVNSGSSNTLLIQLVKWAAPGEEGYEESKKANAYIDNVSFKALNSGESEEENYDILWADDFNESQLDTTDWGYELGSIRGVEQQHYVKSEDNVFMRDGKLVLKATDRDKEDQYRNPRGNRQVIYNSGSVRTHGKQEFLYGRIEMKAKLPKGRGAFPAFWTLGADFTLDGKVNGKQGYGWSRCGEIDIMELLGGNEGEARNKQVWGTPHFYDKDRGDGDGDYKGTGGKAYTNPSGADYNDDYHVFGINWSPDKIEWYVDGVVYNTLDLTNPTWGEAAKKCFNRPQYIQLNLAMGGNWPGDAATNLAGTEFEIDYVYYAQNEEQKAAAKEYYDAAPEISGLKDVTMLEGTTPDLLAGVTSNKDSFVDFSIDNEYMFKNKGGLTNVDLLCKGKDDVAALAKLPAGKYNIHYTAIPNDVKYTGGSVDRDTDYKFTRKTMTLTVNEVTFPSDFKLNGIVGDTLSNVALPEGWSWAAPDTKIAGMADEFDVKYVNGDFSKTVKVTVNAVIVDKDGLMTRIEAATVEAGKVDVYKPSSLAKLNEAIENATTVLNNASATKDVVENAIKDLNDALSDLEKYASEEEVKEVISKGEELVGKSDIYTKDSLEKMNAALLKTKKALADGDKEAIEVAYAELTEAIDGLVKVEISEKPDENKPIVKPDTQIPSGKPTPGVKTGDGVYFGTLMTSLLLSAGGLSLFRRRKQN